MTDAFSQGVSASDPAYNAQECADVKAWLQRVSDAREFDKGARKQYALDRRYARGEPFKFEVAIPYAPTNIDILCSFLYARDPDLDVQPADSTNPPPMAQVTQMARAQVEQQPGIQQAMIQVGQAAATAASQAALQATLVGVAQGVAGSLPKTTPPPMTPPPELVAEQASQAWLTQQIRLAADKILEPYHTRLDNAKQFGKTLEIVVSRMWKRARLKAAAEPCVRSGLSVGVGWLKASWQERSQKDPIIQSQLNDLQDNLARLAATQLQIEDGPHNTDELKASLQQQISSLQEKVEVTIAKGIAVDYVAPEDIQVAPGYDLAQYRDSPWVAHRTFMRDDDAAAQFPDIADKLKKATLYYETPPPDPGELRQADFLGNNVVSAEEADRYRTGSPSSKSAANVCVWEVWSKDRDTVLTMIEGLDVYAKAPFSPDPTSTRFYPFFQLAFLRTDGERHPMSFINRTQLLLDNLNRLHSNLAEQRRRTIPKTAFDATSLDAADVKKLEAGGAQEMVGIKPIKPGEPIGNMLAPVKYAPIDGALYDDRQTLAQLERAWGIQEALAASIRTAKTATEAEIQQTGTNARTSYMRDSIDDVMTDLAQYSSEILLQKLAHEDAKDIAGPWAFWPEGMTIDDMQILLSVAVKGGSSGKPDTTQQQQTWSAIYPLLNQSITEIGQLRQSSPADVADCKQELVGETLQRTGDRLDPTRFLPPLPSDTPNGPMPAPVAPPQPGAQGPPMPPPQGGSNLVPVPHNGNINGHRVAP